MVQTFQALFGAGLTVAICLGCGFAILTWLDVPLTRMERAFFAFVTGSACLSLLVFFLSLIHQAKAGVFLALAVLPFLNVAHALVRAASRLVSTLFGPQQSYLSIFRNIAITLLFTLFFFVYFMNALAPEVSPDGTGYHLGNVRRLWEHHGFDWQYRSMYSYLPQGMEMLFLVAYAFGRHSAAALVHFAFLAALPLGIVAYGRRFGLRNAGIFAGIVVFTSPIVGLAGSSAYNDVALATLIFAVFYAVQAAVYINSDKLYILGCLVSGAACSIKYTAFPVVTLTATWRKAWKWVTVTPVLLLPWLIRSWLWVGNPAAPFLNRWFPNPYFHAGSEQSYLADLGRYEGISHWWEVPTQLALYGGKVSGIIGPVFLLAPFALLALRHPQGRKLLAAAFLVSIPAWFNTGARFLIPSLPFLALALGIALQNSRGVLPALALFQSFACWPSVLSVYAAPWSWRIRSIPIRAALRQQPEAAFLREKLPDLALQDAIEKTVATAQKIFSFAGRAEAYLDRDIIVSYESALGNLLQDILYTPVLYPNTARRQFRFQAVSARGIRAVAGVSASGYWTVNEVRLRAEGREVPRAVTWRFSARPNRWEAGLAFDGEPVTRWSTWENLKRGSRVQVEFGEPLRIDEIDLDTGTAPEPHVALEVEGESGTWAPLTATESVTPNEAPGDLRISAMRQLKARGIFYLLINDSDYLSGDLKQNTKSWGISEIAEANGIRFYRID